VSVSVIMPVSGQVSAGKSLQVSQRVSNGLSDE
jgi:hypothetical protein